VVVESSGTQVATVGADHSLATPTTGKTRVLLVDTAEMVAGDTVVLGFFGPVLAGGVSRRIVTTTFVGPVADPHTQSPPIVMPQGGSILLQQTEGTGRTYPWALVTLD